MKRKLMFGDCLERMKEIPDNSIDMVLTDPPYGTTRCKWDIIIDFDLMWEQLKRITKSNAAICLFGNEPFSSALRVSNIKNFKYDWIWEKHTPNGFLNANKRPLSIKENVSVFYYKPPNYNPQKTKTRRDGKVNPRRESQQASGDSKHIYGHKKENVRKVYNEGYFPVDIIKFNSVQNNQGKRLHPTQKPVPLLQYLINTYTNKGETVLDFTFGSCSTGVACMLEKRNFIGIENDKKYFKLGKKRIKNWKEERK